MKLLPAVFPTLALLLVCGCGTDTESPDAAPPTSPEQTTELEGTWRATISARAFRRAIVDEGFSAAAARAVERQHREVSDFELRFVGPSFVMYAADDQERYQGGTFELRRGDIVLDDEAPTGTFAFAYHLSGDELVFDDGRINGPTVMVDGVPDYLPGAGFWMAVPWTRVS